MCAELVTPQLVSLNSVIFILCHMHQHLFEGSIVAQSVYSLPYTSNPLRRIHLRSPGTLQSITNQKRAGKHLYSTT